MEDQINVRETIVEIGVSDLSKAVDWYSKVFGKKPDLEPFPGNVEYKIGGAWVQIVQDEVKPSSWNLQIEVLDLKKEHDRVVNSGIDCKEIKTVPDVISYFDLKDLDGNAMRWFQVLTSDPKVTGGRQD